MAEKKYYAHTKTNSDGTPAPQDTWQPLDEHLKNVAQLAAGFAERFGLSETGEIIGLLHDFGKYSHEFQEYIKRSSNIKKGDVDHSTAGAQFLFQQFTDKNKESLCVAQILALCIASHHSGLIDCLSPDGTNAFINRINKTDSDTHLSQAISNMEVEINKEIKRLLTSRSGGLLVQKLKELHSSDETPEVTYFKWALFTRILLSCLIDADRLDSAGFHIIKDKESWDTLIKTFESYMGNLEKVSDTRVGKIRKAISCECLMAAQKERGIYSLTVPTGGGKTLASFRFALHHAKKHKLERIIYVLPFTSIIDQNAECIREALKEAVGYEDVVLEHHSNLAPEEQNESQKMLSENWDASVIFTTNVQFLETLFGSGTKTVRRMHRLANALIIFDEVQTIPVNCVHLFNNAINLLVCNCGSTVILSTATQPLLDKVDPKLGVLKIRPENNMVADVPKLFAELKRVEALYDRKSGGWSDDNVLELIDTEAKQAGSVLVVVNTKSAAYEIYRRSKQEIGGQVYHLSANMCPAHRLKLLAQIKARLLQKTNSDIKEPIICISTQLIEAGVDIDFASVIRYLAGLDSIAQAAGRCNRNGLREALGRVHIINPTAENLDMLRDIRIGKEKAQRVLAEFKENPGNFDNDILGPKAMTRYFDYYFYQRKNEMVYPVKSNTAVGRNDDLFSLLSTNPLSIEEYKRKEKKAPPIPLRQSFMSAAKVFRVISAPTRGIVVPYDCNAKELINLLCAAQEITSDLLRRAQRYSVNVYPHTLKRLQDAGAIYPAQEGNDVLILRDEYYHPEFGLSLTPIGMPVLIA